MLHFHKADCSMHRNKNGCSVHQLVLLKVKEALLMHLVCDASPSKLNEFCGLPLQIQNSSVMSARHH